MVAAKRREQKPRTPRDEERREARQVAFRVAKRSRLPDDQCEEIALRTVAEAITAWRGEGNFVGFVGKRAKWRTIDAIRRARRAVDIPVGDWGFDGLEVSSNPEDARLHLIDEQRRGGAREEPDDVNEGGRGRARPGELALIGDQVLSWIRGQSGYLENLMSEVGHEDQCPGPASCLCRERALALWLRRTVDALRRSLPVPVLDPPAEDFIDKLAPFIAKALNTRRKAKKPKVGKKAKKEGKVMEERGWVEGDDTEPPRFPGRKKALPPDDEMFWQVELRIACDRIARRALWLVGLSGKELQKLTSAERKRESTLREEAVRAMEQAEREIFEYSQDVIGSLNRRRLSRRHGNEKATTPPEYDGSPGAPDGVRRSSGERRDAPEVPSRRPRASELADTDQASDRRPRRRRRDRGR